MRLILFGSTNLSSKRGLKYASKIIFFLWVEVLMVPLSRDNFQKAQYDIKTFFPK